MSKEEELIHQYKLLVVNLKSQRAILKTEIAELKQSNTWVSVEERLPETGKAINIYGYLLNELSKGSTSGYYDNQTKSFIIAFSIKKCIKVTHWQPLPTPPKK